MSERQLSIALDARDDDHDDDDHYDNEGCATDKSCLSVITKHHLPKVQSSLMKFSPRSTGRVVSTTSSQHGQNKNHNRFWTRVISGESSNNMYDNIDRQRDTESSLYNKNLQHQKFETDPSTEDYWVPAVTNETSFLFDDDPSCLLPYSVNSIIDTLLDSYDSVSDHDDRSPLLRYEKRNICSIQLLHAVKKRVWKPYY
jgi:hypothetical protein